MATARLIGKLGGASWEDVGLTGSSLYPAGPVTGAGKIAIVHVLSTRSSWSYRRSDTGTEKHDLSGTGDHYLIVLSGVGINPGAGLTLVRRIEVDMP